MRLSECTLEQLIEQKETLEKVIRENKDLFMVNINQGRMNEIERCIKAKQENSNPTSDGFEKHLSSREGFTVIRKSITIGEKDKKETIK